jgi:dTDP-4-amino-4,6-dideoxygalactose transaminase
MPQVLTSESERLALHGGAPAVQDASPARERWGDLELQQLAEAIEQPSLFYWNGPQTKLLVERFREHYPLEHVMPCSSGTAALHIAVAAAGVGPGDEVIVPPITDMGTVIGVLYQQGVPVFADLDPRTYNLDPQSVKEKITPKTKAIIAVHLTGNPCALRELKALADEHDLVLIEDCAQAWGARYRGTPIGTIGHIGCWSLNDFKHIGCGDGGIVASSDERFGPLLQKFGDKAYDRNGGARMPDVLAPNYRISELQSAVAAAQMTRMDEFTAKRAEAGRILNECLADVPGVLPPRVDAADRWTCWFYMLRVEEAVLGCDSNKFVEALSAEGVPCGAGYLAAPLYRYPIFLNENFFAGRWPVKELGLTQMDYNSVCCPETEAILTSCVTIATHEGRDADWARAVGAAVRKVANYFASEVDYSVN